MSMFKHRKHSVPGLNTTSTADISFMLLIFFLVASSMDIDKGLSRQLPPAEHKQQQDETEVNRQRLLEIKITAQNQLLVDGKPMTQKQLPLSLITLDANPESSYDAYFHVQNALVTAYRIWRDRTAKAKFGRSYQQLTAQQREQLRTLCPQRVAETYGTAQKGGSK